MQEHDFAQLNRFINETFRFTLKFFVEHHDIVCCRHKLAIFFRAPIHHPSSSNPVYKRKQ